MSQVTLDHAKQQLEELVEAAMGRETVIITRDGQPLVQLVSIAVPALTPQFGSAQGLITIADDFNEPLTDFEPFPIP